MKKLLFILILFVSISITAQKGYWLCKEYRVIDSTQGWSSGNVGLIIDFTNSKLRHLLKDTVIDVNINKIKKTISLKDPRYTIRYSLRKSSVELKDNNTINVFYQFDFKKEFNFSKEKIENVLINNQLILERDSVKFQFKNERNMPSSEFRTLNYFWRKKQHKGSWCIEKINKNIFIGMTDDEDLGTKMNIYRVIKFNKDFIELAVIKKYLKESKDILRLRIQK